MASVAGCDRLGPQADNGRSGTATLALGTVTVAAALVTAASIILLTPQAGTVPLAMPYISSVTAGTGFTITSLSATDTAKVGWLAVEH